jgi:hypothetical protein
VNIFNILKRNKRRYPIVRDSRGESLRQRCFSSFNEGKRPMEVTKELKMRTSTVLRYFRDWKRLGPNFEKQYSFVKSLFKKTGPDRDRNIEIFSVILGIEKQQFEAILLEPHGLRRFLAGKLYFPRNADADHKMHIVLKLTIPLSDHLITKGGNFEDVYYAIGRYMWEHKKYREDVDADIQEWNKDMEFIHAILAADIENERKGRIKPDTFTEEERAALIRSGEESQIRQAERTFWFLVGILKAVGLTEEQACEKIHQYLVNKGNLKVAEMVRRFQEKTKPQNMNDGSPSSPRQPLPT